jgi:hypothetical protein
LAAFVGVCVLFFLSHPNLIEIPYHLKSYEWS